MPATTKSFIWPCGQRSQNSFLYMKLSRILINIHVHTKYDKMRLQRDNTWKPEYPRDTYNLSRRVLTSSLVFGTHFFSQTITKVALVGLFCWDMSKFHSTRIPPPQLPTKVQKSQTFYRSM